MYFSIAQTVKKTEMMKTWGVYNLNELIKDDKSSASFNQTTNWIVDKLNKFYSRSFNRNFYDDVLYRDVSTTTKVNYFKASFLNNVLIIEIKSEAERYVKLADEIIGTTSKININEKIEIPIKDMKKVYWNNNTLFIEYYDPKSNDGITSCNISVEYEREVNLQSRFVDAFIHLYRLTYNGKKEVF